MVAFDWPQRAPEWQGKLHGLDVHRHNTNKLMISRISGLGGVKDKVSPYDSPFSIASSFVVVIGRKELKFNRAR